MSSGIIKRFSENAWKLAWTNPGTNSSQISAGNTALLFDISNCKWGRVEFSYANGVSSRNIIDFPLPQRFGGVRLCTYNANWVQYSTAGAVKYVYHRRIVTNSQAMWIGWGYRKKVNDTTSPAAASSGYCVPFNFWVK